MCSCTRNKELKIAVNMNFYFFLNQKIEHESLMYLKNIYASEREEQ